MRRFEVPTAGPAAGGQLALDDTLLLLSGTRRLVRLVSNALRATELRPELWLVLEVVAERPRSLGRVASALAAHKGTVSRWLTQLEAQGLVDCEIVRGDMRLKVTSLTALGRHRLDTARSRIAEALEELDLPVDDEARAAIQAACLALCPVDRSTEAPEVRDQV